MIKDKNIVTIDIGKMTQPEVDSLVKNYEQNGYSLVETHNDYWDTEVIFGIIQFEKI